MSRYRRDVAAGLVVCAAMLGLTFGCEGLFEDPHELADEHPGEAQACEDVDDCADDEVCEFGVCVSIGCEDVDCESDESCYRGGCFEDCVDTRDCSQGSRCVDGACMPTNCEGIACGEDERCYHGVCHPTCDRQEHCEDVDGVDIHEDFDPTCDDGVCAPPLCVGTDVLPDGSECPEAEFVTEEVEDLEATAATLRGAIYEVPRPTPTDHGFCWSDETDEPAHGDEASECVGLGEVDGVGTFDHELDELGPGTSYTVRAWVSDETAEEDEHYRYADDEDPVEFTTLAPPVDGVEADTEADNEIEVTWESAGEATGYRIYRDGVDMDAGLDAGATSWTDTDPDGGDDISAPANFEATDGEYSEHVELTWEVVDPEAQQRHTYSVVAIYPDAESAPSEVAEGWLAAPEVIGYRIYRGDDVIEVGESSGDWTVGPDVTRLEDDGADSPSIVLKDGEEGDGAGLSATDADHEDRVELEIDGYDVEDGETEDYTIQVVTEAGIEEDFAETNGYAGGGEPTFGWLRADGAGVDPDQGDFIGLAATDTSAYTDYGADADGSYHTYLGVIDADGAEPVETETDEGRRAARPQVATSQLVEVGEDSATLRGTLIVAGVPVVDSVGVCLGESAGFTIPADPGSDGDCREGTVPGEGEEFDVEFEEESLEPGTTYYARAFADHDATGVSSGGPMALTTELAAPAIQHVAQGESHQEIELDWDEIEGADGYVVYRDGEEIGTTEDSGATAYTDEADYEDPDDGPDLPPPPEAPNVEATGGEYIDRVIVSWEEPETPDGPDQNYAVAAKTEDAVGPKSSWETGYLKGADVEEYHLSAGDEQDWKTVEVDGDQQEPLELEDDEHAPHPTIDETAVSATQGEFVEHVRLEVQEGAGEPGASIEYEIYAVNESGDGQVGSDTGFRGVGELQMQWQYLLGEDDEDEEFFVDIGEVGDRVYDDGEPGPEEERIYRAKLWAEGVEDDGEPVDEDNPIESAEVEGYRTRALVHVGTEQQNGNDAELCRYDSKQRQHWCFTVDDFDADRTSAVAVGLDRSVYGAFNGPDAGGMPNNTAVCRLDADGNEKWCNQYDDAEVWGMATDKRDNVYYTVRVRTEIRMCKYDGDGDEQWCMIQLLGDGTDVTLPGDMEVNEAENAVFVSVGQLDSNNEEIEGVSVCRLWAETGEPGGCAEVDDDYQDFGPVTTDPDGNIYTSFFGESGSDVCKIDADGIAAGEEFQWCTDDDDDPEVQDVAVAPGGTLYTGGTAGRACEVDVDDDGYEFDCEFLYDAGSVLVATDPGEFVHTATDLGIASDPELNVEWTYQFNEIGPVDSVTAYGGPYGTFPDRWDDWGGDDDTGDDDGGGDGDGNGDGDG